MSLQEKLDAFKARFEATASPEAVALMHRATDDLRRSGIMERVLRVGDKAPHFELLNARGEIVSSRYLLAKGPLIISFYRGVW